MTPGVQSAPMTQLILIRHGATAANERVPFMLQGNGLDLPLSAAGETQAQATAQVLSRWPLAHIYSSQMHRARQTAAAIAGPHELPVQSLENLHECNVGSWEGLDWQAIEHRFPEACRQFKNDPLRYPMGGESYTDVFQRVQPVFADLWKRHAGKTFAVVAHNVVNRVYLAHALGGDLQHAPRIRQANGCVNLIRNRGGVMEVVTINSIMHLPELPA